jgi:hypothetical protein
LIYTFRENALQLASYGIEPLFQKGNPVPRNAGKKRKGKEPVPSSDRDLRPQHLPTATAPQFQPTDSHDQNKRRRQVIKEIDKTNENSSRMEVDQQATSKPGKVPTSKVRTLSNKIFVS